MGVGSQALVARYAGCLIACTFTTTTTTTNTKHTVEQAAKILLSSPCSLHTRQGFSARLTKTTPPIAFWRRVGQHNMQRRRNLAETMTATQRHGQRDSEIKGTWCRVCRVALQTTEPEQSCRDVCSGRRTGKTRATDPVRQPAVRWGATSACGCCYY